MSNSSLSLLHWSTTSSAINRYVPLPLLVFGTFGNFLNILVFTRKSLRKNSCVQYLLASTIGSFFVLYVGMMSRLLNGYGQDYTAYSSALCKIRYFITYLSLTATSWFISFGCMDRYCSSSKSVQLRSWCQTKIAVRVVSAVVLVGCLIFAETFYCFNSGRSGTVSACYTISVQCQVVDGLLLVIFYTTIPIFLMIVFGSLTLKNIRQSRQQIVPDSGNATVVRERGLRNELTAAPTTAAGDNTTKIKKRDLQILMMLLVQVGIIIVFSSPTGLYKFYAGLTATVQKTAERIAVENFLGNFFIILTYINYSMMFFVYTLTGRVFRNELAKLIKRK